MRKRIELIKQIENEKNTFDRIWDNPTNIQISHETRIKPLYERLIEEKLNYSQQPYIRQEEVVRHKKPRKSKNLEKHIKDSHKHYF